MSCLNNMITKSMGAMIPCQSPPQKPNVCPVRVPSARPLLAQPDKMKMHPMMHNESINPLIFFITVCLDVSKIIEYQQKQTFDTIFFVIPISFKSNETVVSVDQLKRIVSLVLYSNPATGLVYINHAWLSISMTNLHP